MSKSTSWLGEKEHQVGRVGNSSTLDIEPVDPRAGGYVWTAVDGSLAIALPNAWHNAAEPFDVDGDGKTAPADVLALIHYVNAHPGEWALPFVSGIPAAYYDVNRDRVCTAIDVLAVVNHLNATASLVVAEGEWKVAALTGIPSTSELVTSTRAEPVGARCEGSLVGSPREILGGDQDDRRARRTAIRMALSASCGGSPHRRPQSMLRTGISVTGRRN